MKCIVGCMMMSVWPDLNAASPLGSAAEAAATCQNLDQTYVLKKLWRHSLAAVVKLIDSFLDHSSGYALVANRPISLTSLSDCLP